LATRDQRAQLPKPDQTEQLFGAEVVARLACDAGVPETKIPSFGDGLRCAVKAYLRDARRLNAGEIRDAIEHLSRAVEGALNALEALPAMERPGAVEVAVKALLALPTEARALLDRLASATGDNIPGPSDLCDSQKQYQARISLYGLCGSRAKIVPGKKRPGGKQSEPVVKQKVISPLVKRGRTPRVDELVFCASVGQVYLEATGRPPGRRSRFPRLMDGIVTALGIKTEWVNIDELLRAYKKIYKKADNNCQQKNPL